MIAKAPDSPLLTRRRLLQAGVGLGSTLAIPGTPAFASLATRNEPGPGFARPEMLASVDWLQEHIGAEGLGLIGFMPPTEFAQGHIPGSAQLDWPELEVVDTSDESIAAWQAEVTGIIGNLGITPERTVVVYDPGTLFAARLWWVLHHLGHADVRVLDGGLAAWQQAGGDVEAGNATVTAADAYAGVPNHDTLAGFDDVMAALDQDDVVIVDARTVAEFTAGHIPGAVNVNYPLNAEPDPPRFWKPAADLMDMYDVAGVNTDRFVIPYCSSGVRSAVTAFTLHLLGFDRVALYTGSWQEWSSMPEAPVEAG